MSKRFVIVQRPGPSWQEGKPFSEQKLLEHGNYMKELYDAGKLLHGGPFLDNSGGLVIIQVESLSEAEAIVKADPAIQNGVFTASLHPWFSVDWDSYGS